MSSVGITVGSLLREWRIRRGLSQLTLALETGISTRHLSFLETGKSSPSREMLWKLSEWLSIPNDDRNAIWLSAGFRPPYSASDLFSPKARPVREAVEQILRAHEPSPALACDFHWNLLLANGPMRTLIKDVDPVLLQRPINILRLSLASTGLAPHILNFDIWSAYAWNRISARIRQTGDRELVALRDEVFRKGDAGTAYQMPPSANEILLPIELSTQDGVLRLFSATTQFTSVHDAALSNIMIESFHPVDEESREGLRRLHERAQTQCATE